MVAAFQHDLPRLLVAPNMALHHGLECCDPGTWLTLAFFGGLFPAMSIIS